MDCLHSAYNSSIISCGRSSCIILYRGEDCFFCDVASEMLNSIISQYGVSNEVIREIDIDSSEEIDPETAIVALPTIRICDSVMSGLPEEDLISDAIIRVLMKDCFSEHIVSHNVVSQPQALESVPGSLGQRTEQA
ncbi:MAG: hypothetical protein C4K49_12830 [Candidatus Thorarchaeota archaeon]|nr:MAG: hypothetical protein C4K49_12830 [Candidatus Thorarchaeota archaeon]